MAKTLNVRISDDIEQRLENLAEKTKRPKSFYIKDMLEKYLDESEEAYLALERISEKMPGITRARRSRSSLSYKVTWHEDALEDLRRLGKARAREIVVKVD
jgi:RHH-type rel operon transcriptional repressor/antitoxin RelB